MRLRTANKIMNNDIRRGDVWRQLRSYTQGQHETAFRRIRRTREWREIIARFDAIYPALVEYARQNREQILSEMAKEDHG